MFRDLIDETNLNKQCMDMDLYCMIHWLSDHWNHS